MRVGLATIHHGRPEHLRLQAQAVAHMTHLDRYLVVAMDDTPVPAGAEALTLADADPDRLALAAARNRALEHLADCDLVILLDVDCLPSPQLAERHIAASRSLDLARSVLLGPVGWLSESVGPGMLTRAVRGECAMTVKRDFPDAGIAPEPRPELFWSLAYAISPAAHARTGGFDEAYRGWGAEDTDFGRRALRRGLELWKVAGAWAYHQPHPPAYAGDAQIAALVENARRFRARWGDWPMPDVLERLVRAGRLRWALEQDELAPVPRSGIDAEDQVDAAPQRRSPPGSG